MPFVPVPSAIMAELVYNTPGGKAENTLWFTNPATHDASMLLDLCVALGTWWNAELRPVLSNEVSLASIKATSMVTATSPAIEYTTGFPIAGGAANPVLPSNVTIAITFLTAFRGRSNRGRNYIIGLSESAVQGDTIHPDYAADIKAAYDVLQAAVTPDGFDWVVASRYSGVDGNGDPIPRVSGQTTPVTGTKIEPTIDSQRRRLRYRGQ